MQRWRRLIADRQLVRDDSGNASLEFVTAGLVLLLPLVYLVLTMASIQAGSMAVEGAARQAVRVYVQSGNRQQGEDRAERAIQFALADYGLDAAHVGVSIICAPRPTDCLRRLGTVTIAVQVAVALPLVPAVVGGAHPLSVTLKATATEQVSRFWSSR